jgi:hypothetical protein
MAQLAIVHPGGATDCRARSELAVTSNLSQPNDCSSECPGRHVRKQQGTAAGAVQKAEMASER